jgi:hypothetical protein
VIGTLLEKQNGLEHHRQHDADRGENGDGRTGDQQEIDHCSTRLRARRVGRDGAPCMATPGDGQAQNHTQSAALPMLQVSVVFGGGQHGGVGRAGHDVAADQILEVVDHQIQPIRRQLRSSGGRPATTRSRMMPGCSTAQTANTISAGRPHHRRRRNRRNWAGNAGCEYGRRRPRRRVCAPE